MWLIGTESERLCYFADPSVVKYAILSHTWGEQEITFQDMARIEAGDKHILKKIGYNKIKGACSLARRQGLDYVWVDTCSIDKSSSAELSEAINSMFAWYRQSAVCYVYLSDLKEIPKQSRPITDAHLSSCRWFQRGWTLQELIAPSRVEFYDRLWTCIGTKVELRSVLSKITAIESAVLDDASLLPRLPVARRMSWAARRTTTRIEDMAYCLMGIFDVNMPLLYGEGHKAFLRLQDQIFTQTNDLSLFAWEINNRMPPEVRNECHSLFAFSPEMFANCSTLRHDRNRRRLNKHCRIDDNGFEIDVLTFTEMMIWRKNHVHILDLNCARTEESGNTPVWLGIRLQDSGDGFKRESAWDLETATSRSQWYGTGKLRSIRIPKHLPSQASQEGGLFQKQVVVDFDPRILEVGNASIKQGFPSARWSSPMPDVRHRNRRKFESDDASLPVAVLPFTFKFSLAPRPTRLALVVSSTESAGSKRRVTTCGLFDTEGDMGGFAFRIADLAHRAEETPQAGNRNSQALMTVKPSPSSHQGGLVASTSREDDGRLSQSDALTEIQDELFMNCANAWGELSPKLLPRVAVMRDRKKQVVETVSVHQDDDFQEDYSIPQGYQTRFTIRYSYTPDR